ncbi:MAG TPA: NUDIX domain-containing protein [Spirochaetia bacterium]
MLVKGVDIDVECVAPEDAGTEHALLTDDPFVMQADDEASVRAACAGGIEAARERGAQSLALPAMGLAKGMSPVISAKILVQEAIRVARSGGTGLTRIVLCCPDRDVCEVFARTVNGYLRHFLDVLVWGPFVTVDAIIEVPAGVVLVKRSNPPLGFALPGGFVDYGESLETAVQREAMEETGLVLLDLRQFHTYSDPSRDPRFQTVTTVFTARAEGTPRAGDDAADVRVVPRDSLAGLSFAFDHGQVLRDWLASPR